MSFPQHLLLMFLSALVTTCATLGWGVPPLSYILGGVVATGISIYSHSRGDLLGDLSQHKKTWIGVAVLYFCFLVFVASESFLGEVQGIRSGVSVLCICQAFAILYAGNTHDGRFFQTNTFAILFLGLLSGGIYASAALLGYVLLIVIYLVATHCQETYAPQRMILPTAIPIALAVIAPLALILWLLPPKPHEVIATTSAPITEESEGNWIENVFQFLLLLAVFEYLRRRYKEYHADGGSSEAVEFLEIDSVSEEELRRRERFRDTAPSELRRHILEVYDQVLHRLDQLGYETVPSDTFRSTLKRTQSLLGSAGVVIAQVAERARYHPSEPAAQDLEKIQAAARVAMQKLPRG